ncbi:TPR-like protein [Rhizophagus irregularis]|uniref:TPR-like protein n=1 Tax=Rhizophagus irregularis TaxID=588596 RepID=A0A2I1GSX8_9GLOM|nr:TPR-like protein [Rhizophagus irregularis]
MKQYIHSNYYDDYIKAIKNYNIALKNDPNNYLCLKNCAYVYEKEGDYLSTLNLLDKLLNINKEDSLVLCYYGEILYNMTQYRKAISYFTKAYTIDPENIHNLNRRAITYYIIKEYDKVLSDLDKIIQLDPLNSSAYYLKCLTYYTKNDNNKAKVSFKKYAELSNSNILAKIQLFHLEYLLNKNSSKDLNDILTKIDQFLNFEGYNLFVGDRLCKLLYFIRYKIYVELKEYSKARLALNDISCYEFESIGYFIQDHPDFRSYLYEVCEINKNDFTEFGIVDEFSKYMYKEHEVYFVSNLTNLNSELCQFQESDISRRAITYYIIKEYDKVLSDLDKIIQLDPLNNSAYYLKILTYYTKNDNNQAKVSFKKYAELLKSDNALAKVQLFHLEYLLNKNSSKDLNNILTKINQIHKYNIYENSLLHFIKCKIYIELKEYNRAKLALNDIPYHKFHKFGFFMQDHPYFWSYLYEFCKINKNYLTKFGIVDEFSNYMYKEHENYREDYMLKHKDVSRLEGLGWIEYRISIYDLYGTQLSIEINSIEMKIEYVRFERNLNIITYIPDMSLVGYLLPNYHKFFLNVPETFKDKYFSRNEMENLLDLKDILNSL